ncbi:eukaryotic translation initiation factor 2D isoform X6 [Manis pentadactyla]|uniref:eukaryotic translation initiation factor 2D isoform X6 n=1 Tax=Manis pentadactyla TaxID=143292 RepID=UPI00255C938D|nr:eukaryotic translation initiation factor 2D isoform X6 [Manis pentadactyla]
MFAKAFRVKSNTAIKGSDRRKLRADVTAAFPTLGTDQISELVPGKEELNVVKLYTHRGEVVTVYVSGGNPILFELEKNLYPTGKVNLVIGLLAVSIFWVSLWAVYTLWSYPDLLPTFTTWPLVLEKLVGGADLMLPGVVVPPAGLPQSPCCRWSCCHVHSPDADVRPKGKGLLCAAHPPGPLVGDMRRLTLEGEEGENRAAQQTSLSEVSEDPSISSPTPPDPPDSKTLQEQMDELLHQCFLHALKSRVKKADLPLLTSTFLGSHVFSCCPEGQQLDIKKSSYKKLSKFLQRMQQEQIIQVKELSKGVESIVAVAWKHPRITSFVIPEPSPTSQTVQEGSREQPYHPPDIKPLYCVPASMTLLFQESGHKKGSVLEGGEVRKIIIDYVKKNDLVDANNKNLVKLDPILCDCMLEKNEQHTVVKLPWDSLLTRCLEKLQPAYQVTFSGQEPIVKKGKVWPIDITLAQRASNKKVTVVRNLEAYGLDPCSVAAVLQQRCQASTTVTSAPGAKDRLQVQVQGNQIHHLSRLLLDEYQLPRKYIQGLEKAPKPGKKK